MGYGMDRWVASGRPGRSQLRLVPPKARPEPHSKRGLEIQNSTNAMHLETRDSTPTCLSPYLCKQSNPPVSGGYREKNKIKYLMSINTALQRTMRKHCSLISKENLFILSFIKNKQKKHITLEPPGRSSSTASHPPTDDNHKLRTE